MSSRPGPLAQAIASALRAELARRRLSGRWLAEQIGESNSTVARWLAGQTHPCADKLDRMCRALGFTAADLMMAIQTQQQPFNRRRRATDRLQFKAVAA